jgi:hypothetical protein
LIEVLGDPDLRLTCPGKAWEILVVDDQRSVFRPRHDTHEVHGRQGPGLTGEEMGAKLVVIHGHVELADAGIERITLVGIGRLRGGADMATPFGNIPFANVPSSHSAEFRFSARRSRLSFLALGDVNPATHLGGWGEFDFLGERQGQSRRARRLCATELPRTNPGVRELRGVER